jgi:phenylacetate-coenzyme A ligase PaaK-like adenylate-forming protein
MENLTFSHIAWDTWRATKGGIKAVEARQQRRLKELVEFVRTHSDFYEDKYNHVPDRINDVQQLPPVMKPELLKYFDGWMTDHKITRASVEAFISDKSLVGHHYLGRYFVCTTSGTTGVPTVLIHDQGMLALSSAVELARAVPAWDLTLREWRRFVQLGGRIAAVFVTGGHFQGVASIKRRHLENPRREKTARMFSALAPLPEIVAGLNEYQPAMLAAYPSSLALLAEEQEQGRLHINPVLVLPTGETLTDAVRQQIESAFHTRVRQNYGASEMPVIAYDCGKGGLHVNADWVIFEAVDEEFQPVLPGQVSHKVLITNLANRVQPFIRYEMGDRVTVNPEPCACGSPLPSITVEGRNDDILRFTNLGGQTVPIMPMALWSVIKDTPGAYRFQAIQTAPEQLKVRLQAKITGEESAVWELVKQRVQNYFENHGLLNVKLVLAPEPPTPNPVSGKFRYVWAELEESHLMSESRIWSEPSFHV